MISIHALLAESDIPVVLLGNNPKIFLSTLSLRRATNQLRLLRRAAQISIHALLAESDSLPCYTGTTSANFYPRSPCGERRETMVIIIQGKISIHALLAESDAGHVLAGHRRPHFYPRSPCGERHTPRLSRVVPTPNFYPRSPCGERHPETVPRGPHAHISIHALLAESDAVGVIFVILII